MRELNSFHMRRIRPLGVFVAAGAVLLFVGCSSGSGRVAATESAEVALNDAEAGVPDQSASGERAPEVLSARAAPPSDADPILENPGFREISSFRTDFSRATIRSDEIVSGGPPKDGIPAVDDPSFESIDSADEWLGDDEPVFVVSADGESRIYPVQILTYHEIVNDVVGDTPVSVTYCPLCNSGLTFRREFDGRVLDFGTTGRLRLSNLVMYDRQSETWWQQATGEGLVGLYAGYRLDLHPMLMLPWDRARERFADAMVLSRETGFSRPYGNNPYAGYDTSARPFLFSGRTPGPFTAMDRVLEVVHEGESAAIPYPEIEADRVIQRDVGGLPIVAFWEPGTASALDSRSITEGRDVGSANAFDARVDGRTLTFSPEDDGTFRDVETGTIWDASGFALSGELGGMQLEPVVGVQHFWFSYSAFANDGRWTPLE